MGVSQDKHFFVPINLFSMMGHLREMVGQTDIWLFYIDEIMSKFNLAWDSV
jgi:hypothetical protein